MASDAYHSKTIVGPMVQYRPPLEDLDEPTESECLGRDLSTTLYMMHRGAGQSTCRRHAHMRTCEEVGITVEAARNLEAFSPWTPPLSAEPRDADDLLAGLEHISSDDVAAGFAGLKELKRTEEL
ncbi:uncharacterized protein HD556DRAFT_1307674 [Suillus plorans]|uniref:Uncharacterized protein n=1 Tax=Suillus plorans TaxID=116603 RepID=A0A9P7ARJ6_9AGAM|nr:uncharacterized protein HD556DRAFT_1307674 [Suillus plorans]KAG1795075.1 hypothetical protein HD556DRAFT_1307674 [Suillus plorans]